MTRNLSLDGLVLLLLLNLQKQSAVDMWQDTSEGNGSADQSIQLLVTTDGELEVARGYALDLKIFGGILQNVLVASRADIGIGRLTPASSRTSAVRYSRTAVT